MKNKAIIITGIVICLLNLVTSCSIGKSTYTNATMGSTAGYVAKPIYDNKNESAIYVTGEFGNGNVSNNGGSDSNSKTFAALNVHRAHAYKNFNLYYGAGGQFGTFKFPQENFSIDDTDEFISAGKKNFYALQVKTGINYLVSRPYADFRILGLDLGFISEFGPYLDTLEEIESKSLESGVENDDVGAFSKPSTFYVGLSSEIIFKINKKNSIGINPFVGRSFLESKSGLNPNVKGLTLSYRYSDFSFSLFNEISNQGSVDTYTCKFGLAYKLN